MSILSDLVLETRDIYGIDSISESDFLSIISGHTDDLFGGVRVSEDIALRISVVYACIRYISEDFGALPRAWNKRVSRTEHQPAENHFGHRLMMFPNPVISDMAYYETGTGHIAGHGDHFAELVPNQIGEIREMWPIHPDKMKVKTEGREKAFFVRNKRGGYDRIPSDRILHIQGFGDGIRGKSVLRLARENLQWAQKMEEYNRAFFSNHANVSALVGMSRDVWASEKKRNAIESRLRQLKGAKQGHSFLTVPGEDVKVHQIGISPEDVQFIATLTKAYQIISLFFRMPLYKLNMLEDASYNNVATLSGEYATNTLRPYACRWESGLRMYLNRDDSERMLYYPCFDLDGLLRGDPETQWQNFIKGLSHGIYTRNEIRAMLGLNPVEGGDDSFIQLGMVPAEMAREYHQAKIDKIKESKSSGKRTASDRSVDFRRGFAPMMDAVVRGGGDAAPIVTASAAYYGVGDQGIIDRYARDLETRISAMDGDMDIDMFVTDELDRLDARFGRSPDALALAA